MSLPSPAFQISDVASLHALRQLGHVAGLQAKLAADEPFLETALTPLAEVLFTDGDAFEFLFDDVLDLFEAVEPGEDLGGGLGAVRGACSRGRG
ncbi:MAG: hypothetical protein ABSA83_09285 [Verrucomicrobiota bacterium]|jgi:hypothetical protein